MKHSNSRPRVVVTGLGAITPLGSSVEQYWDGLMRGRSGIRRITQFDASELPCQIAGEIPDFNPDEYLERKEIRRTPRCGQIALASVIQAVQDSALPDLMPEPERCGVFYGTVLGGVDRLDEAVQVLRSRGVGHLNPFMLPSGIPNLPAFLISLRFKCLGPNCTISTACATGTQAIGEAVEVIRRGAADIVITGGSEAQIMDLAIGGFCAMRALPVNFNQYPESASRPFDAKREGFVYAEGAAGLVLENLEHALARNARIYAEIVGFSSSADAYHIAAPEPEGLGPSRAMQWALQDSGLLPEAVDYINAHGSSTPINDVVETRAIKRVFGDHAYHLAVSSTKSMIGHPMGGAGALEAIACILAIHRGWIPPTINYEYPDPDCDLDYVPNHARQQPVVVAMSNSFGLGGQNACLIFREYRP